MNSSVEDIYINQGQHHRNAKDLCLTSKLHLGDQGEPVCVKRMESWINSNKRLTWRGQLQIWEL